MAKMTKQQAIELLKDRKVYVNGKIVEIQDKLYALGWKWHREVIEIENKPFVYIDADKELMCGNSMTDFVKSAFTEISADEIRAIELVEYNFKPFDKVLVRENNTEMWKADFFSHYNEKGVWPYGCCCGYWQQCIPYEGNEHLIGKADKPIENKEE